MPEASAQGGAERSKSARPILFELARLAAVVALPLLGVITFLLFDAPRRDIAQATNEARSIANETAARSERFLGDFRATLEGVAHWPLVRAMDPAKCDPAYQRCASCINKPPKLRDLRAALSHVIPKSEER